MDYKIIVARYNENTEWTSSHEPSRVVVYNKGDEEIPRSIKLDNVGREAHTYLRHIITNYHSLNEVNAFVQGNPFEHIKEHGLDLSRLLDVEPSGYSAHIQDMSNNRWGEEMSNAPEFTIHEWKGKISNMKGYNLGRWWEMTTGERYLRNKRVFWSAIFSVRRELIWRRSLESYIRIYQSLLHDRTPVEAHYCERTWCNIFRINDE